MKKLPKGLKQKLKKKKVLVKAEDYNQIRDKKNQTIKVVNKKSLKSFEDEPQIQWIYKFGDLCQINMKGYKEHGKIGIVLDIKDTFYLLFVEGQIISFKGSDLVLVNHILSNL